MDNVGRVSAESQQRRVLQEPSSNTEGAEDADRGVPQGGKVQSDQPSLLVFRTGNHPIGKAPGVDATGEGQVGRYIGSPPRGPDTVVSKLVVKAGGQVLAEVDQSGRVTGVDAIACALERDIRLMDLTGGSLFNWLEKALPSDMVQVERR